MRTSSEMMIGYKIPNRRKKLITREFLKDLKIEHDNSFVIDEDTEDTYNGWYSWYIGTSAFDKVFEVCCKKHNIYKGLYLYVMALPREDCYRFLEEIMKMMVSFNIIKMGNDYVVDKDIGKCLIVKEYKGYTVKCYV